MLMTDPEDAGPPGWEKSSGTWVSPDRRRTAETAGDAWDQFWDPVEHDFRAPACSEPGGATFYMTLCTSVTRFDDGRSLEGMAQSLMDLATAHSLVDLASPGK